MELKDFYYQLPTEQIAQYPAKERDSSRLLVLDRKTGAVTHEDNFTTLVKHLKPGDCLVLNDTKVIPARLFAKRQTGGESEVLLVRKDRMPDGRVVWQCMIKNSKGLKDGSRLTFAEGVEGTVKGPDEEGFWSLVFDKGIDVDEVLLAIGKVPLPPYIRREATGEDRERYQTVFAGVEGAIAAPTAGLHFTPELIEAIKKQGVDIQYITLHTGPSTFLPVRVEDIREHKMSREFYSIAPEVYNAIKKARKAGRRIVAVGSTCTRALESASALGLDKPMLEGDTRLFIYPGFEFKVVDALLTNFHLPGSTLLMLVSAFAGREQIMKTYEEAVAHGYRFFTYGDAMLIK